MSARESLDQARIGVFAHTAIILAANVDPAILDIGLEFGAQTVQEERRVLQTYTRVDPPRPLQCRPRVCLRSYRCSNVHVSQYNI